MCVPMVNRITVDLDKKLDRKARRIVDALLAKPEVGKVGLYLSASGRGYHIIAKLRTWISADEQIRVRRELGDCRMRCQISEKDLKRGYDSDVMFTHKWVGGEWRREEMLMEMVKDGTC